MKFFEDLLFSSKPPMRRATLPLFPEVIDSYTVIKDPQRKLSASSSAGSLFHFKDLVNTPENEGQASAGSPSRIPSPQIPKLGT